MINAGEDELALASLKIKKLADLTEMALAKEGGDTGHKSFNMIGVDEYDLKYLRLAADLLWELATKPGNEPDEEGGIQHGKTDTPA